MPTHAENAMEIWKGLIGKTEGVGEWLKIEQSRIVQTFNKTKVEPTQIITGLYLAVLSRFPTDQETRIVTEHFRDKGFKSREAAVDLTWALLNSAEFLYRH